jgi:hypothetical protein
MKIIRSASFLLVFFTIFSSVEGNNDYLEREEVRVYDV